MPDESIEEQPQPTPPRRAGSFVGKMLLIVVLALVSSAGGGVVAFFLINKTLGTQASLAVSGNGEDWILINAAPDLREQVRRAESARESARSRGVAKKAS